MRLRHVLDRITIYTCPDINSLLNTIQSLREELTPCTDSLPILVVIDPLSTILTNLLWANDGAGKQEQRDGLHQHQITLQ